MLQHCLCIAGVFLAKAEKSVSVAGKIITRFTGERGAETAALATATIRGVVTRVVVGAVVLAIMYTEFMTWVDEIDPVTE